MRLTFELLDKSTGFTNTLNERELDLRGILHYYDLGNGIPDIENLIATKDHYQTIDLTDNEISSIKNLPLMHNLETLILSNNNIEEIDPNFSDCVPNLKSLILANNRFSEFRQLAALSRCKKLQSLVLIGNSVTKIAGYHETVASMIPNLRFLDFCKTVKKPRKSARLVNK